MHPYKPHQQAFSLIGLMITISIITLLSLWSITSFSQLLHDSRLFTSVSQFYSALQYTRSSAIKSNSNIVLCPSQDKIACSDGFDWSLGWIIFHDLNYNRKREGNEDILRVEAPLPHNISMQSSKGRKRIRFQGSGMSKGYNSTFTFCDQSQQSPPRVICLSSTGRARITDKRCNGTKIVCS